MTLWQHSITANFGIIFMRHCMMVMYRHEALYDGDVSAMRYFMVLTYSLEIRICGFPVSNCDLLTCLFTQWFIIYRSLRRLIKIMPIRWGKHSSHVFCLYFMRLCCGGLQNKRKQILSTWLLVFADKPGNLFPVKHPDRYRWVCW